MCADAWGEGAAWKICYIKSRMFIMTCLAGTGVDDAGCLLF